MLFRYMLLDRVVRDEAKWSQKILGSFPLLNSLLILFILHANQKPDLKKNQSYSLPLFSGNGDAEPKWMAYEYRQAS